MGVLRIYNLGTGQGSSVLDVIKAFELATGAKIPYQIVARRAGDVPVNYSAVEKAHKELGWKTEKTLEEACRDSWNFQKHLVKA